MKRKTFLQTMAGIGSAVLAPIPAFSNAVLHGPSGSMVGYSDAPIEKVRIGIIGLGNRGNTLTEMLSYMLDKKMAEVVALSDLTESKVDKVAEKISKYQTKTPEKYFGNEDEWKKLAKQEDVDLILICTPWRWHAPMCLYGMRKGKHVASEVPIAYTLDECYSLVHMAEKKKRHCIMIENCLYNDEELFVLNLIQQGVFGEVSHAEGAYIHDLRKHLLDDSYYQGQWRLKHHLERDGNFYTTHGLGPIAHYMNIGRGDTFSHLTSMSSNEVNLSRTAEREGIDIGAVRCGDMNTTLIKTAMGKSIMLQFDVHTPRPYSRINKVVGTKATHDGYPSRLYIDDEELLWWGHKWLDKESYDTMREEQRHPMIKKLKSISEKFKQGHGGMDFVMMYRLIRCLNLGLPLDSNVYDGVMWSAVTPLSEQSVAEKSSSIKVPDFTGGTWKEKRALEIMRDI